MKIIKRCYERGCIENFPAKPNSFTPEDIFCEKHQDKWEWLIKRAVNSRHVNVNVYDVWDEDRPIDSKGGTNPMNIYGYERVCRICGGPLLTKKGKYFHTRRYCKDCDYFMHECLNWGSVRAHYVNNMICSLIIRRGTCTLMDGIERKSRHKHYVPLCELCFKPTHNIEVHHKIPVHTLDISNYKLVWDIENLIGLCHDCHRKQDHQLGRRKEIVTVKYRRLEEFT